MRKPGDPPQELLPLSQMAHVMYMFRRYRLANVTTVGLTLPQYNALVQLDRHGKLNPSRIAELLFSDRPTTTVILRNLARQGWIERGRDETNRKYVIIRITPAGRKKLQELRDAEEAQASGFEPLGCFTTDEREKLESMLDRLILHFRDLPRVAPPDDADG